MLFSRKFIDFIIHSNVYLSLGALSFAFISLIILNLSLRFEPLLIPFSTTFFLYNLNRKTDKKEDSINYPARMQFLSKYGSTIFWLSIFLYVPSLFLAAINSIETLLIALIPTLIMILYAIFRLKKIFLLKNIIASFGWAAMVFLVGSYYNLSLINLSLLSVLIFIFLRLFMNTVIFDIRDMNGDKLSKIITIPVKIGIRYTKLILILINAISFIFILLAAKLFNLNYVSYLIGFIAFIYGLIYISLIGKVNMKKLCEAVDGEMIFFGFFCFLWLLVIK